MLIILGNFLKGLAGVLHMGLQFFYFLMIARIILSFVSPDPRNPIVQFIYATTEPVLGRIRDKIPTVGMFDLSPIVVFMGLYFVDEVLVSSLYAYGVQFLAQAGVLGT